VCEVFHCVKGANTLCVCEGCCLCVCECVCVCVCVCTCLYMFETGCWILLRTRNKVFGWVSFRIYGVCVCDRVVFGVDVLSALRQ